jgi:hypothetical protein
VFAATTNAKTCIVDMIHVDSEGEIDLTQRHSQEADHNWRTQEGEPFIK